MQEDFRQIADDNSWLTPWAGWLLCALAAFLFFLQLHQPLLDPDEGRQAEVPREMLAEGDWLVPHWRGEPYFEKPPLQYWITAALYYLMGVAPATARLVPACAAWLTVLLTYWWGKKALGVRAGFLGALVLCLTPGFVFLGRTVLLDSLLTVCVVGGWLLALLALERNRLHPGWWILSAVVAGLGILQKGPVVLVLVSVPVFVYARWSGRWVKPGWRAWGGWLLLAVAIALPWYVAISVRHPEYPWVFLWRANVVRYVAPYAHQQPCWFYVPVLFATCFPWSLLWPALGCFLFDKDRLMMKARRPGTGFAALAFGWCFAFFSLAGCKSFPYLMPALPPLALMTGALGEVLLFRELPRGHVLWRWAPRHAPLMASMFLGICLPGVFLARTFFPAGHLLLLSVHMVLLLPLAWGVVWLSRRGSPLHGWALLAAVTLFAIVVPLREVLWAYASRRTPEALAQSLRSLPGKPAIVLFDRDWPSAHFYLERKRLPLYYRANQATFVREMEQKLSAPGDTAEILVLVENDGKKQCLLDALPKTVSVEVRLPNRHTQPAVLILRPAALHISKHAAKPVPES